MPESNAAEYANHVPAGVRRAAQRAEEAARTIGAANVPAVEAPAAAAETPAVAPAVTEPPAPAATAAPVSPPAPAPIDAPEWEQRYRTLQGKYDAEVPQLRVQIDGLQRVLATMQQPAAPAPTPAAAPAAAPATNTTVVPKEDVEAFGEDLIAAAQRWAEAKLGTRIAQLETRLAEVSTGQQRVESQTVQQRVLAALDADPEIGTRWRALNGDTDRQIPGDQQFLAWLNAPDPFSGVLRRQLLQEAYGRGDTVRTAAFFRRYLAEHTAVSQPAMPAAPHTAAPAAQAAPAATARPSLADLAVPGRTNALAPGGAPADKRLWSNADITAFYRDRARGIYSGREAEALRMEQDLIAAAVEGRIR